MARDKFIAIADLYLIFRKRERDGERKIRRGREWKNSDKKKSRDEKTSQNRLNE